MGPVRLFRRFAPLLCGALLVWACAAVNLGRKTNTELLADAHQKGIPLVDPLYLADATKAELREKVGTYGTPVERLRRLMHFLVDSDWLDFQYHANTSLSAEQAFHARGGDCTSYANLLIASSRALDIEAYYVRVSDMPIYYEHQGTLYLSSHMAVGFGVGSEAVVVDFSLYKDDWKLGLYHPIDDEEATALFNTNLAVVDLVQNRPEAAERRLRFLLDHVDLPDLVTDLGVALTRQGRHEDAYRLLTQAIQRFPGYQPLYVNAASVAREVGQPAEADRLENEAQQISEHDPYLWFGHGLALYQQSDFAGAATNFQRALAEQPDNVVILAWSTRAHLAAGNVHAGERAFSQLLKVNPNAPFIADLRREYPSLRKVGVEPSGRRVPVEPEGGDLARDQEGVRSRALSLR